MNRRKLPFAAGAAAASAYLVLFAGVALAATSPTVTTGSATSVNQTTAVLNGDVNASGTKTSYSFQYGTAPTFGAVTATADAGSSTSTKSVQVAVTDLAPGTTYYYRIDASNALGSAVGATKSFRTTGAPPPGATTGTAQGLSANGVTLTGVVYPAGDTTTYYFNYGLTTAYGLRTASVAIPAGTAPVAVSAAVPGLQAGATFHFQLVAVHSVGAPAIGADASFETFPSPAPVPRLLTATHPGTIRRAPFAFRADGRIVNPSATPASLACVGTTTITVRYRGTILERASAPVQPDCTFAADLVLSRRPAGPRVHGHNAKSVKVSVAIHFEGNNYLAPADSDTMTLTLG
jgi:hypothetical protein